MKELSVCCRRSLEERGAKKYLLQCRPAVEMLYFQNVPLEN